LRSLARYGGDARSLALKLTNTSELEGSVETPLEGLNEGSPDILAKMVGNMCFQ
jgi:hypothetical protein